MKTFFKPDDFREIYKKIMRDGYKSHGAGEMWEPDCRPDDIAKIANEKLTPLIAKLEARVEKLKETLTIAEKTIYDSTEMFAHYDDCVALVTDEDEPDYECTCGRDKMVLRTIDARFLIKAALKEDEEQTK